MYFLIISISIFVLKPAERLPVYFLQNMWSHQESNLDLKFRKLLFYPLNYETVIQKYKNILINERIRSLGTDSVDKNISFF